MDAFQSHPSRETFLVGFGETGLGQVLVATSSKGIVAILIGDDPASLRRDMARAFPVVRLDEEPGSAADAIAKVVALMDAPHRGLDLPLDLRGSELELAVWGALRAIPSGETRTYGGLAKSLDVPATAQEVGAACAANVVAVAVPCHRVVKVDGSISGYRWGVARKRRLINLESVA